MLTNRELEDLRMVFPYHFREHEILSRNMVVCSFVSSCVEIRHVHGDL